MDQVDHSEGVRVGQARTRITTSDVKAALRRQGYRCALTGDELTPEIASLDHVVPLSRGGEHRPENIQVVTRDANRAKGPMVAAEFVEFCRRVVAWHDAGTPFPTSDTQPGLFGDDA